MRKVTLGAMALALPLAVGAAESYTFDPFHTYVNFAVDHLGFSTLYGRFDKSSGKAMLDRAGKKGAIEFVVETGSINTGDSDRASRPRARDEHLRGTDFFNSAEFPRMTFKSTAVKFAGENVAEVEGQMTLLGVTKPLTLKIERWKCGAHPFSKREMCGGNAIGKIRRSDFGMKYGLPAVGDEITLLVGFEAYRD
jgi:polyisoprenoid-binding protein YceI